MDLRATHRVFRAIAERSRTSDVMYGVDEDDCAVIKAGAESLVVTADFINSSPAIIELGCGGWYELGELAVCHNLADLAGSGARPIAYLSGLCVERTVTVEDMSRFTQGVVDACERHACPLVGGDTKFGQSRSIFGTAIGLPLSASGPFCRTLAEPGYDIVCSSELGAFASSVVAASSGPDLFGGEIVELALASLASFNVGTAVVSALASGGGLCAGTDLSDGLGLDLCDMCDSSGCGAEIWPDAIPVNHLTKLVASEEKVHPWSYAFASGGDFACIYAVPPSESHAAVSAGGTIIGRMIEDPDRISAGKLDLRSRPLGHTANRNVSFHEEIRALVMRISECHGN